MPSTNPSAVAARKWRAANPDKAKAIAAKAREKHRDKRRIQAREAYRRRLELGLCGVCGQRPRTNNSVRCDVCRARACAPGSPRKQETNRKARSAYNRRLRQMALDHYGHRCACCGLDDHDVFLTIDHMDGKGAEHRRQLGHTGNAFLRWLRDNHYPSGFQTLCWNCNSAKHLLGQCPHHLLDS